MASRWVAGSASGVGVLAIVACSSFGTPADDNGDGGSGSNGCPSGKGPSMVRVDGKFCIDSTEVTHAEYKTFLDAMGGNTGTQIPECALNTSFHPDDDAQWKVTPGKEAYPVTQVDWCDAYAFCTWSGKRLCGRIGTGGPVAPEPAVVADAKIDEWFYACSEGGKRTFPYGATFDREACNIELADGGDSRIYEVKFFPRCEGGFPGIFDMSGNVSEWVNSCTSSEPSANCLERSSGFYEGEQLADCATFRGHPRTGFRFHIGIRCCAN